MSDRTTRPRPVDAPRRRRGVPIVELLAGDKTTTLILRDRPVTVGRSREADVVLDSDGLSREHAKLIPTADGSVQLVDLQSTNGTFVNGERISVALLRHEDALLLGPDVRGTLRYAQPGEDPRGPTARLTARQQRVAKLVAEGLTSAEIGHQLGLSPRTVESHLQRIFQRLQIRGRAELTRLVTEARLQRPTEVP